MKNVLGVVITEKHVEPECWQALLDQDYPNFDFIVSKKRKRFSREEELKFFSAHPQTPELQKKISETVDIRLKYKNCSDNRETARQMALANSWADYFLFVDSDVVLPADAVSNFMMQAEGANKEVLGGWYKMVGSNKWVAGRWVADNTFLNFLFPQSSLVRTDLVGLGCALISRAVLEKITFESGVELECFDAYDRSPLIVGECGVFGNKVAELGIQMYMDGSVICEHLKRRTENDYAHDPVGRSGGRQTKLGRLLSRLGLSGFHQWATQPANETWIR